MRGWRAVTAEPADVRQTCKPEAGTSIRLNECVAHFLSCRTGLPVHHCAEPFVSLTSGTAIFWVLS